MSASTDPTVMLLRSFFLATMAGQYEEVMQRAEKEGWLVHHSIILEFDGANQRARKAGEKAQKPADG